MTNTPALLPNIAPDAVTIIIGSDRYGATVLKRSQSGHRLSVRMDRVHGDLHVADPNQETKTYSRCKDGRYKSGSSRLHLGELCTHMCPEF